ncbi:sensor histidine kinase [Paenibacillus sp. GCM10027626]|uniref:cache domain-containing sensor histidine kinase n=1 Tax=Paenibacillus sp. GCM10027626 TaxID=3273411 RepID=UPI00363C79A8
MKWLPFKSIQTNMAAMFAGLILSTVLLFSFIAYQLSASAVRITAEDYTAELVRQVNANIRTYVDNMHTISSLALNNRDVRSYIANAAAMPPEKRLETEERISDFFHSVLISRKDIASINIFGYDGTFVSDRRDVRLNPNVSTAGQSWYKLAKAAEGEVVVSSSHVQPIFKDEYRWVVSLSRELRQEDGTGVGILLVDLNFNVMNDMLAEIDLGQRGYVFIIDYDGKLVYHPQQQLVYSGLKSEWIDDVLRQGSGSFMTDEGKQSRIYTIQDSGFGWKIVGVSYASELVGNKRTMAMSFVLWGGLCLLVAIMLSVLLSRTLSRPIKRLQERMREVERGNLDIFVPVDSQRETGLLARTFNIMVARIKELMSQVVREQEFKRQSELNALQAQINPHFLYNTLDSIVWMAEAKRFEEVVLMTSALARLFRSSISKNQTLVPIRTEIEHISNYLTIQKMRYRNKMDYRIDVDPDILDCRTIKVLLQPLVENAIYHGLKNKYGSGMIEITGKRSDSRIIFTVTDDGVGMDEDTLHRILMPGDGPEGGKGDGTGIGVANVHERIRLYFGREYGLSYESEPEEGTTVTVVISAIGPVEADERESAGRKRGEAGEEGDVL